MKLVIKNAKIFDPKNGIDGQKGNIYLKDGRISRPFKKADREIDATGLWALPAGIETGIPFASYGLSFYGYKKNFPGPKEISRRYAQMGYTHLHESMMFPSTAPGIHHFLSTLPYQDTSASLCLTLREFGTLIGSNIPPEWAVRFFNICAHRFRALNIRLPESSAHFKKSTLARYNIQAQKVFDYLSRLPLSFPLIVELTSRLLDEDLPQSPYLYYGHIGRAIDGEYAFKQVSKLITEKKTMGDIGLAPQASHSKLKIEAEIGEDEEVSAHIGMHTPLRFLEVPEKSQSDFVLTLASHPNFKDNLAFSSSCLGVEAGKHYPSIFQELFERDTAYTISDFIKQTRVLPAAILGLENKGHLGIGAEGDVALYEPENSSSTGEILSRCHTLIKNGIPIIEKGQFLDVTSKLTKKTYFRSYTPSERDLTMFAGYFKSYPRLEQRFDAGDHKEAKQLQFALMPLARPGDCQAACQPEGIPNFHPCTCNPLREKSH